MGRLVRQDADLAALRRCEGAAAALTMGAGAAAYVVTGSLVPVVVAAVITALFVGMYEAAASPSPCADCGGAA
jgi:hypothetical protein